MLHEQQLPLLRCQSSYIAAATGMGLRALLLLLLLALAFLAVQWSPRLLQPQSRSTLRLDASAPSARRLLTSGAAVTPPSGAAADDIGQVRLSRTVGLVVSWLYPSRQTTHSRHGRTTAVPYSRQLHQY